MLAEFLRIARLRSDLCNSYKKNGLANNVSVSHNHTLLWYAYKKEKYLHKISMFTFTKKKIPQVYT